MTENKRFVNIDNDIYRYGEWWCSAGGEHCADVIATAMNEIMDKNVQLKRENKEYIRGLDLKKIECESWASDVRELREQNYQLEKENEKLNELCVQYDFDMGRLEEENEELKSEIRKVKKEYTSLWMRIYK